MQPNPSSLLAPLRVLIATVLAAGLISASSASAEDPEWKTYWKNGTRIESNDGQFKIKIGGRIHVDFSFADEDEALADAGITDGTELRRARLFVSGELNERVEFKVNLDFAGSETAVKDVYVGLINLPGVGGIRVGHIKEPFSFEEMSSSKYLPFIERSMPVEAFAPSRNMGLMLHNSVADDRFTWAAGAFKEADNRGRSLGDEWNVTGRFTGLILDGKNGDKDNGPLLHLGASLSSRSPNDDSARYRARPQSHLSPRLVDTRGLMTEGVDLLGVEAVFTHGPFWASAEQIQADLDSPTSADLSGFNVQLGWFITGERRAFKKSEAVWDRIKPKNPFLRDGGSGAWEVSVRYADLDLTDGLASGGEQDGLTLAVNWYLNSATRVMFNYASTDVAPTGSVDFLILRFSIDF